MSTESASVPQASLATPRIRSVRTATTAEWQAAFEQDENATFFQSPQWADCCRHLRLHPAPWMLDFGEARALVPASERVGLGGLVRTLHVAPAGTYGTSLRGDSSSILTAAHHKAVIEHLTHHHTRVTMRLSPTDPMGLQGLDAAQLPATVEVSAQTTRLIDLGAGLPAILADFSKGHRAAARQAERAGICIRRATSKADWQAYHDVYLASVQRWGDRTTTVYPPMLFEALSQVGDSVSLWLACDARRIVAGALCLHGPQHVAYWHGAAAADAYQKRPVHLLLRTLIEDSCQRGLRWFDFNPSGALQGVDAFKKGFGARLCPAPVLRGLPRWRRLLVR